MADQAPLIHAFNAGEIGRDLHGRVDQPFYRAGARTLLNAVARVSGAAESRPGTRFVAAAKIETDNVALIDFEPQTDQAYVIEAGELYFRFHKNKAPLLDGATPVEVITTYAGADVGALHWAQSVDVLYLTHTSYHPRTLSRLSDTSWVIADMVFIDGPYLDENPDDAKTLELTGGGPWLKGDTTTMNAVGHTPFLAGHVGSIWRLQAPASVFVWVTVTAFTDTANVVVEFEIDVPAGLQATAVASWREGLWSDVRGYPGTVSFHDSRLTFGGSFAQPWSIDASASGLFLTFAPDVGDGDAIQKVLAGNGANAVRWLLSGEYLFAGTSKSVMRIGPRDSEAPITPANTPYKRIEGAAASAAPAALLGSHVAYIGRHGESLHAFPNRSPEQSEIAEDVSLRARHITERGLEELAWQADPRNIVWARLADGGLAALTFVPAETVAAWSDHGLAGTAAGAAAVESIVEIPGAHHDELWLVVRRTIDGSVRRYIEVLEVFPHNATPAEEMWYVDSGISYSGPATLVVGGLDHLEGEMVNVWSQAGPQPPVKVIAGQVTLEVTTTRAQIGLGFRVIIAPLPIVPQVAGDDPALAKEKRIARLAVQLDRSIGFDMGRDLDNLTHVSLDDEPVFGQAPALFTGIREEDFPGDWGKAADVVLVQDQSGPLTVLAIQPEMETGD